MSQEKMREIIQELYSETAVETIDHYHRLVEKWRDKIVSIPRTLSEKDAMLITYPDSFMADGEKPLATLNRFLKEYMKDHLTAVHILPMFPYTSDDGFSIVDYRKVNPPFGDWKDIESISKNYDLMFDAVINHTSKSCDWFHNFLAGDAQYKNYYIAADPNRDYSMVVRPRTYPLFTVFDSVDGPISVWTTFSEDQVDLNFKSSEVLLEILDILAYYVYHGAKYIRLDAITYAWKENNSTCANLEQTHKMIKLIRLFIDEVAPGTLIITETNVPHKENIAYMGNGTDEATMVYQFALPPLVLHTYLSGSVQTLNHWIQSLSMPSGSATYFNFLASHDGIGMQPVNDILSKAEKQVLIDRCTDAGGRVSYKNNSDGSQSVYELNVNYNDVLTPADCTDYAKIQRFLGAQFIMLSLQGVPGIYCHSILGSNNDIEAMISSGINRRINRRKIAYRELASQTAADTVSGQIFSKYLELLDIRKCHSAFSPYSSQEALAIDPAVFCLLRCSPDTGERMMALVNVSGDSKRCDLAITGTNLLNGDLVNNTVTLQPYEYMWVLIH